jgi:hypothetical protein
MDLHDSAIETHRFDLDADELFLLQLLEEPIQHARFSPAIHPQVDRMPVAKPLRQSAPFAAVLRHVEDRVDDHEILMRDVATLARQERFDASKLFSGNFHTAIVSNSDNRP